MKCFYHKEDLDGQCSGAIIKAKFNDCQMIGINYKGSLSNFNIDKDETIFIVDFSFPMKEMKELNEHALVHWIDHHKSSMEEAEKINYKANVGDSLKIGTAACRLTWDYLYPDKEEPLAVKLIGLWDVWDHSDIHIKPFQLSMRGLHDTSPDHIALWEDLFKSDKLAQYLVSKGKALVAYQEVQDKKYAEAMAFTTLFHGYKAIAMNKSMANSSCLDAVYDPEKHDIMILFGAKKHNSFKYSIYSDKPDIDVSKIAMCYGGGGHAGAAGFYSHELIL